jgi:hypothetical protein
LILINSISTTWSLAKVALEEYILVAGREKRIENAIRDFQLGRRMGEAERINQISHDARELEK